MHPNLSYPQTNYDLSRLDDFEILKEFVEACDMAFVKLKTDQDLIKICLMTSYVEFMAHFNKDFKNLLSDLLPPIYIELFFSNPKKSKNIFFEKKNYLWIKKQRFDAYALDYCEFAQNL